MWKHALLTVLCDMVGLDSSLSDCEYYDMMRSCQVLTTKLLFSLN